MRLLFAPFVIYFYKYKILELIFNFLFFFFFNLVKFIITKIMHHQKMSKLNYSLNINKHKSHISRLQLPMANFINHLWLLNPQIKNQSHYLLYINFNKEIKESTELAYV